MQSEDQWIHSHLHLCLSLHMGPVRLFLDLHGCLLLAIPNWQDTHIGVWLCIFSSFQGMTPIFASRCIKWNGEWKSFSCQCINSCCKCVNWCFGGATNSTSRLLYPKTPISLQWLSMLKETLVKSVCSIKVSCAADVSMRLPLASTMMCWSCCHHHLAAEYTTSCILARVLILDQRHHCNWHCLRAQILCLLESKDSTTCLSHSTESKTRNWACHRKPA